MNRDFCDRKIRNLRPELTRLKQASMAYPLNGSTP
jgi:hypothetical protein